MSIILFLIILAALILVHEFGHFAAAKLAKIRVDEFAIGFPPRIWAKKIGETIYSINWLPIGGFVKIFGENPDKESIEGPERGRSFIARNRFIQAGVLVAGVFMNVVFAWVLFAGAITIGLPVPNGYAGDKELLNAKVAVIEVLPNSPASEAGLQAGDRIISIEKKGRTFSSAKIDEVQNFIAASNNENLNIKVENAKGETRQLLATPKDGVVEGKAALGVSLAEVGILKLPFWQSVIEAAKITGFMFVAIILGLFDLIKSALIGQADFSQVAGPVGIVSLVGDASTVGVAYLLSFIAMISVNLAVINLIPFPALDGGRLLFVIIEGITRRTIKPVIANTANAIGFALLMILMVVITYKDITRLF